MGILWAMHPDAPLRRITTWLAILGYTLVASGLPLPVSSAARPASESAAARRLADKDRSRSFPCMDKPCGCISAEQCFTRCCCNTPAETLVWARAHAVEPGVLAALERRVACTRQTSSRALEPSCCSSKARPAEETCCTSSQPTPSGFSEGDERCPPDQSFAAAAIGPDVKRDAVAGDRRTEVQPRIQTVTLRAMLACGGIVAEWCAAGAVLPPPRVELCLATGVVEVCMPGDESGECLRASPAAPPPRAA